MARVRDCSESLSAPVLAELAAEVSRGAVLALPTESSYALCVSPFQARAVERLIAAKGRPDNKPILVLIGQRDQLTGLVWSIPPPAEVLMERFWPGSLTMVLPAPPSLPSSLTAGTGTIGIRLPAHDRLRAVLTATGPLTGTSANRSGAAPCSTAAQVAEEFPVEVDTVVDCGLVGGAAPSTLVTFEPTRILVLREGPVTMAMLREVLTPVGVEVCRYGEPPISQGR